MMVSRDEASSFQKLESESVCISMLGDWVVVVLSEEVLSPPLVLLAVNPLEDTLVLELPLRSKLR